MVDKKDSSDSKLFRLVMQDVKPIKRRHHTVFSKLKSVPIPVNSEAKNKQKPINFSSKLFEPSKHSVTHEVLTHGDIKGLDRRTGLRLKRGQFPIEACLDLHGMTQREAYKSLCLFIDSQHSAGRRCIIVVTGKGRGHEGGGVLKTAVPKWLNAPPNRNKLLAFEYAIQKDGGSGALYVLLKRKRSTKNL